MSGAVVEGGGVSIAAVAGAELTGAAACTFLGPHPASESENPHASNAASARASMLRLGIYVFVFSEGLAEVANSSCGCLD